MMIRTSRHGLRHTQKEREKREACGNMYVVLAKLIVAYML